jgi:dimethylargininase
MSNKVHHPKSDRFLNDGINLSGGFMVRSEGERLTRVVVCSPKKEYTSVTNLKKHNITELANGKMALLQHDTLKTTIKDFGCQIIDLPELENHPNSVFTRDASLCTPEGYIKLRLGIESRLGEEDWMARALDSMGIACAGKIKAPGTVDGGDVVLAGQVAFIGKTIRTNGEGINQLSELLKKMNYEIRVIPLPDSILHLDKALMLVNPRQILYCSDLISKTSLSGFDLIEIETSATTTANIICLGDNEVIVNKSNQEVIQTFKTKDIKVHTLDLSEFVKGTGGPNCLIMPVERKN